METLLPDGSIAVNLVYQDGVMTCDKLIKQNGDEYFGYKKENGEENYQFIQSNDGKFGV